MPLPFDTLQRSLSGEILWDDTNRRLYANDASIYQVLPLAVAFPKNADDCRQLVAFAAQHHVRLTARGAATSLAGQAVGNGIIVDFTRHMNRILSLDVMHGSAIVEPGVVADDLNRAVSANHLCFPPDPSSKSRCTIGGMIANNAWGAHAPHYGDTASAVIAIDAVLADASIVSLRALDQAAVAEKTQQPNMEGKIYSDIINIISDLRATQKHVACAPGVPNNMGYALNECMPDQGAYLNLARLFCGSEGTLGLITQATVALKPVAKQRYMVCIGFSDVLDALQVIVELNQLNPAAIELMDETLLNLARESGASSDWIPAIGQHKLRAVLILEFFDLSSAQFSSCRQSMNLIAERHNALVLEVDAKNIEKTWTTRRNALAQLMKMPGQRKPVSFVEDCAVPVESLYAFTNDVLDVLQPMNLHCVFYGSVSRGLLHVRPFLDLSNSNDKNYFRVILKETARLLVKYQGSISAKHGDGHVRAGIIGDILSEELRQAISDTKSAFDPNEIFNPCPLQPNSNALDNLRADAPPTPENSTDASLYLPNKEFDLSLTRCNGAGLCLQTDARSRMCPTYHLTRNELQTTRGRANLIRQALAQSPPALNQIQSALKDCLSCKACQSDCPAQVDMARVKSELMHRYPQLAGSRLHRFMLRRIDRLCKVASRWPKFSNRLLLSSRLNRFLSIHPDRPLPQLNRVVFSRWAKHYLAETNRRSNIDVWILNDIFNEYFESAPGIALVNVLQVLGLNPGILPGVSKIRILLSNGHLNEASKDLVNLLRFLRDQENQSAPIIGIEPSELLSYRDEAVSLLRAYPHFRKYCENQLTRFQLIEEFVAARDIRFFNPRLRKVWLHQHCHQKAQCDVELCAQSIANVPNVELHTIETGCCGMAGFYGYHKDSYAASTAIARQGLLPKLESADVDDIILASGFSCRTQIRDLSYKSALHPAEFFATYISVI